MIEERAIVSRVGDGAVWVKPFGVESCSRCAEGRGCGGGVLGRLVGRTRPEVQVGCRSIDGLRSGDTVIVGVEEAALMQAALWVYLVPLVGMFSAGVFAHSLLQAHDLLVAAFGLTGLVGGFALTRIAARSVGASVRFRPVLLRRAADADSPCARLN